MNWAIAGRQIQPVTPSKGEILGRRLCKAPASPPREIMGVRKATELSEHELGVHGTPQVLWSLWP